MAGVDTEIERMIVRLIGDGTSFKRMLKTSVKDTDQFTRDVLGKLRNSKNQWQKEFGSLDLSKHLTGAKLKDGAKLQQQMATATEKHSRELQRLNNLLQVGAINQNIYDRAVAKSLQATKTAAQQPVRKLATGFSQTGSNLKSVGSVGSMAITAPLLGIGVAAVNAAVNYEKAFTMIKGLTGTTDKEVSLFQKKIESLAVETGRAPQELADAMYFLASSGLKANDAMDALEVSAKASAVGLGQTKIVADLVSSVLNAYGTDNISAKRATDILVAAIREGKGEATDFAQSMGFVIPIASQMGISFDQVAGSIAAMTQKGMQVDHATTALKGIMTEIIHPSEQAEDALKGLKIKGISTFEDLRKSIKDRGLLASLTELWKITNGDVEAMGKLFPEVRGLTGIFNLLGQDTEKTATIIDSVTNSAGALEKAFAITADSAGFKLDQTMSELKLTLIGIGNEMLPLVLKLAQFVSESLKAWQALSPEMKSLIITFAEFTAVVFPAIYVLGLLSSSVGSMITLYALLNTATGGASVGMLKFALGLGPVAVAAMMAAAAVLYLRNMINQANAEADKSRDKTDRMADAQLDQIRNMAGPEQKEAMDMELERRKQQLVSSKQMRDKREEELREEGSFKKAYRSTAGFITGADEMESLNKEVEQAEKAFELGQQFKKEMSEAEIAAKNAMPPSDIVIDAENGVMTKAELKNLNKSKSQAETLRKANLSPEQKITEDLQMAIKGHDEGNLTDEDFQNIISNLQSKTEKLRGSPTTTKNSREADKLRKQIADRSKTPAQKKAEEVARLKNLENDITNDAKTTPFNQARSEEQVKRTNSLLSELVTMEKEKKNQTPVLIGEAEGF